MQDINDLALKMQMRMLMVSKKVKRQKVEPAYAKEHGSTNDNELENLGIK